MMSDPSGAEAAPSTGAVGSGAEALPSTSTGAVGSGAEALPSTSTGAVGYNLSSEESTPSTDPSLTAADITVVHTTPPKITKSALKQHDASTSDEHSTKKKVTWFHKLGSYGSTADDSEFRDCTCCFHFEVITSGICFLVIFMAATALLVSYAINPTTPILVIAIFFFIASAVFGFWFGRECRACCLRRRAIEEQRRSSSGQSSEDEGMMLTARSPAVVSYQSASSAVTERVEPAYAATSKGKWPLSGKHRKGKASTETAV